MVEPVDLGAENDERMARLREALALGNDFQLVIVQVEPGELRDEVLQRLAGWSGHHGVPTLALVRLSHGESPVIRLAGEHSGVILVGLEEEGPDRTERMRQMVIELNWSRDRLPELVHGPLVLVVSQRVQAELFEQAPDFYSWRTHSTSIVEHVGNAMQPLRWFASGVEDPADLETMIGETLSLHPRPLREVGQLYARLARAWSFRGEDAKAEIALGAAADNYASAGTPKDRTALLLLRSEIASQRTQYEAAEDWLRKARQEPGASDEQVMAKLLRMEAMLALDRGHLEAATAAFPGAIQAARAAGDLHGEAILLVSEALLASRSGRLAEEIALLEQAAERLRTVGPDPEAAALTALAGAMQAAGRGDDAERYGRLAVARAEASGSAEVIAISRAELGRIACQNGDLELAEEALRPAVTAARAETKGRLAEARAKLALRRGDDINAERHLREALEAYGRGGAQSQLVRVSLDMADLGLRTHRWPLAQMGMDTADRLGDARQRAVSAYARTLLAMDRAEPAPAVVDLLALAIQKAVEAKESSFADTTRVVRASALLELGRDTEARSELEAALVGFEARGQAEHATRVRDLLAQLGDSRTSSG